MIKMKTLQLRLDPAVFAQVQSYRKEWGNPPSISDALRQLIDNGLRHKGEIKFAPHDQGE